VKGTPGEGKLQQSQATSLEKFMSQQCVAVIVNKYAIDALREVHR